MKMKWILTTLMTLTLGVAILGVTGCNKSEPSITKDMPVATDTPATTDGNAAVKYTCPMHPEIVKDAPGNCPKCGMKLVVKK